MPNLSRLDLEGRVKVYVRRLEFYSDQGISHSEREVGHRFSLDLEADIVASILDVDELSETVDYAVLAELAVQLCRERSDLTVESACRRIGKGLLEAFPQITGLNVSLGKLKPALNLSIREVGVKMRFERIEEAPGFVVV